MNRLDPRTFWRQLPRKVRIGLIFSVLLLCTGTEVFALAPQFFELAVMIDLLGSAFVLGCVLASVHLWFGPAILLARSFARRVGEKLHEHSAAAWRDYFVLFVGRNFRLCTLVAAIAIGLASHWVDHHH